MAAPDPTEEGGIVDDFKIMEKIGAGAFSRVHIAEHLPTKNYCAVKIIDLGAMKEDEFKGMLREIAVFMQVDHPNICHLYRISTSGDKYLLLFMEYAPGGTLLELVNRKKGLSEGEAQIYFNQLFSAVRHLHMFHFLVHRDLKLENVLLGKKNVVKLTDFGLAGTSYNNLMHTFVGTPGYQPPEIIAGNEYTEKCDVWSLGICLYAMIAGRLPFSNQNSNVRLFLQEVFAMKYPPNFSPALVDLLKKMLAPKPEERPSLIQLQDHPWLRGLEKLGLNIAPQPIIFHIAKHVSAIAKFRRKKIIANLDVLKKCEAMGINVDQLKDDLLKGQTTPDTATYFIMCYPYAEKPETKKPAPELPPPLPADAGKSGEAHLPVAREHLPLLAGGKARQSSLTNLGAKRSNTPVLSRLLAAKPRTKSSSRFDLISTPAKRRSLQLNKP